MVRELLQLFPGAAKAKDKLGNLPLFLACRRKRVQTSVIKAILKAYPEAAKVKIMGALALHHLLHTGSHLQKAHNFLLMQILMGLVQQMHTVTCLFIISVLCRHRILALFEY